MHHTDWSIKKAEKEARRRAKKKAKYIAASEYLPPVRAEVAAVNVFSSPSWEILAPPELPP